LATSELIKCVHFLCSDTGVWFTYAVLYSCWLVLMGHKVIT